MHHIAYQSKELLSIWELRGFCSDSRKPKTLAEYFSPVVTYQLIEGSLIFLSLSKTVKNYV